MVKDLPANAGDIREVCSIPGLERSPGECWIPPKKRYPISKGKGEALVRKSHLESNPICVRDAQRAQKKPCVCQEPGGRR